MKQFQLEYFHCHFGGVVVSPKLLARWVQQTFFHRHPCMIWLPYLQNYEPRHAPLGLFKSFFPQRAQTKEDQENKRIRLEWILSHLSYLHWSKNHKTLNKKLIPLHPLKTPQPPNTHTKEVPFYIASITGGWGGKKLFLTPQTVKESSSFYLYSHYIRSLHSCMQH